MKLGTDYMWMIELRGRDDEWFPRPDLSDRMLTKAEAERMADMFAAQNGIPRVSVRVEKWRRI